MITKDRKVTIDHDLVVGHTYEVVVKAITSDGRMQDAEVAPRATIYIEGVLTAPMAPTAFTATPFLHTVFLKWTNPTDSDFDVVEVWRHTADVVASATKIGEVRTDAFVDNLGASGVTRYYWIRARNTSGVVSEWYATAGTAATTAGVVATDIADFAVTATKMFTQAIILNAATWTNNSPVGGSITWNTHTVVYNGATYNIAGANTNLRYVYWVVGDGAYSTSATHPTLGTTGFMIATNEAGITQLVWNSSANMVIGTAFILDAAITNAKIANLAVDNAKINDLAVSKLTAGTISSKAITLAVAAGTGDVYIAAGKTDFDNTVAGFILGCDDSDSDLAKLYIGDSTKFLNWDGAALTVQGKVQTAASGQRMVMDNSDNTLRFYNSSNVNVVTIDDSVVGSLPGIYILNGATGGVLRIDTTGYEASELDHKHLIVTRNSDGSVITGQNYSSGTTDANAVFNAVYAIGETGVLFCGQVGTTVVFRAHTDGTLNITGSYKVDGTQVVGNQGAAVADATDAASTMARLNDLLARCRTHGLIAT